MERLIKLALLGKDLAHSVSPELHELLFPILSRKYFPELANATLIYQKIECENICEVAQWLKTASVNGYSGANVTIPYKEEVASLVTNILGTARLSKSINAIKISNEETIGITTDGDGLLISLQRSVGAIDELYDADWHFFGAGGAVRSAIFSMLTIGTPRSITVASRNLARAELLIEDIDAVFGLRSKGCSLHPARFDMRVSHKAQNRLLLIQGTPLGQKGNTETFDVPITWRENDIAVDFVFNPLETEFLRTAKSGGATAVSGLGMLIEQAALAEYFWFCGRSTSDPLLSDAEYKEVEQALTKRLT